MSITFVQEVVNTPNPGGPFPATCSFASPNTAGNLGFFGAREHSREQFPEFTIAEYNSLSSVYFRWHFHMGTVFQFAGTWTTTTYQFRWEIWSSQECPTKVWREHSQQDHYTVRDIVVQDVEMFNSFSTVSTRQTPNVTFYG